MKNTMKLLLICFLTTSFISLNSCSPEDGQDGAQGPQGPQGVAGQDGVDGQDGEDGNANVQTGTVDLVNEDWLWNSNYSFSIGANGSSTTSWFTRYADLTVPEIDMDIDENGLVLVYFKPTSNSGWTPLPFQFNAFGSDYFTHIVYESSVGNIRLHYFWTPNQGATPTNLSTFIIAPHTFKYVVIQGTAVGKDAGYTLNDYKKMSYEDLMDHFGLDY